MVGRCYREMSEERLREWLAGYRDCMIGEYGLAVVEWIDSDYVHGDMTHPELADKLGNSGAECVSVYKQVLLYAEKQRGMHFTWNE